MKLRKVISGGQTGVDQIGLRAGYKAGLETGGTAPWRFRTDVGPEPRLGSVFGLKEHVSYTYPPRTEDNVQDSNGTVIFGDTSSPGCKLTKSYCRKHKRPFIENPTVDELVSFIGTNNIEVLNVAGNRAKNLTPEQMHLFYNTLIESFKKINEQEKS
jgi:hypothetical protein